MRHPLAEILAAALEGCALAVAAAAFYAYLPLIRAALRGLA